MTNVSGLPTVARVMITMNGKRNLQDYLRSASWVDGVVVIDVGRGD